MRKVDVKYVCAPGGQVPFSPLWLSVLSGSLWVFFCLLGFCPLLWPLLFLCFFLFCFAKKQHGRTLTSSLPPHIPLHPFHRNLRRPLRASGGCHFGFCCPLLAALLLPPSSEFSHELLGRGWGQRTGGKHRADSCPARGSGADPRAALSPLESPPFPPTPILVTTLQSPSPPKLRVLHPF